MSVMSARALCTDEEREEMYGSRAVQFEEDGSRFGVAVCQHPTRLHEEFTEANLINHGNELLSSEDLGDGWTRARYRLGIPPEDRVH